jgi:pyridoxal phosphate enzyme (YggS family)
MSGNSITESAARILRDLPEHVTLVAAAKTRTPEEVAQAIEAGIEMVGHNYVQEARAMIAELGARAQWHMVGHLQSNKAGVAAELFDMIQTLDSVKLARALDRKCAQMGKVMPVLVEVNSGREEAKAGVLPEDVDALVQEVSGFEHVRVQGLMTMGPFFDDPERSRPYFRATREAFERLAGVDLPNVEMRYLSMGMSDSYLAAIKEGANMVRIGTSIFGPRSAGG